jgi:hypothetical protein
MKTFTLLFFCQVICHCLFGQPSLSWQRALGGGAEDKGRFVQQTSDGGFVVAGWSQSNNGNVSGQHGNSGDFWVAKLDGAGNLQWQKCLGGTGIERAECIRQTSDGGFIVVGNTNTLNDGDVSGMHIFNNSFDVWVVKLSGAGSIEWQRCYGGYNDDHGYSVFQTADGGYIIGAYTKSTDGDIASPPATFESMWVFKISGSGIILWQTTFGTVYAPTLEPTTDGGFVAMGMSGGIVPGGQVNCSIGNYDLLLVKFNSTGVMEWQKCLGGTVYEEAGSVRQTTDGGYIIAGTTGSQNGDVSGNHGNTDAWVVKVNSTGAVQWQRCLGGTGSEYGFCARQTSDGGYIVAADLASADGDVSSFHGGYWIVKLDAAGVIKWQKNIGYPGFLLGDERPRWIEQTIDGGYIINGTTRYNGGDVTGVHGDLDFWVVKLDCATAPVTVNTMDIHNVNLNHNFTNDACGIIARIIPSGSNAVSGNVTAKVTIEPAVINYKNQYFVQRHYDIEPSLNATTATGTITLYFTQQDFDNFNSANGTTADLPTGPGDVNGKNNLRIIQLHGTGTMIGNYSGTIVAIDPDDSKIIWNAGWSRWEITFDVNGFSGFFISNIMGALPVDYVYFTGRQLSGAVQLRWQVENQVDNQKFEIERSNGQPFSRIGEVAATSSLSEQYEWKDLAPGKGKNLYRLKQIDKDNRWKYSSIVQVDFIRDADKIYPNPAQDRLYIDRLDDYKSFCITDITGRMICRHTIIPGQQSVNIEKLVSGMYIIRLEGNRIIRVRFTKN